MTFTHHPTCTWYRTATDCDCEQLLLVLDSPSLQDLIPDVERDAAEGRDFYSWDRP